MKLSVKNKMDSLGITRYQMTQLIDITYPTMNNIYFGESTSIKLEILEKLCEALHCTPNDILTSDITELNNQMHPDNKEDGTD
mgnify:CR=1 FL=1